MMARRTRPFEHEFPSVNEQNIFIMLSSFGSLHWAMIFNNIRFSTECLLIIPISKNSLILPDLTTVFTLPMFFFYGVY